MNNKLVIFVQSVEMAAENKFSNFSRSSADFSDFAVSHDSLGRVCVSLTKEGQQGKYDCNLTVAIATKDLDSF